MPLRISGINLPDDKQLVIALTSVFGIGRSLSRQILEKLKIEPQTKTKDLDPNTEKRLRDYIEDNIKVEGDLRRETMQNIKHYKDAGCYRGERHNRNLPVRGQRTRTNSRTVRGNIRKTAGSGRRSASEKT